MRFDTKVTFWQSSTKYVPGKGYGAKTKLTEIMANVTDLGTNRSKQLFGEVQTGNKIIGLVAPVGVKWDSLTISGDESKTYVALTSVDVLKGHTLMVGEKHG